MRTPHEVATDDLATWNAADDGERLRRLDGWAEDARYSDPMMAGEGRSGIATMIAGARAQVPGHGFVLAGTPDGHGPFVRFAWTLAPAGGAPVAFGTDVLRLDAAGRIAEVIGFLDRQSA